MDDPFIRALSCAIWICNGLAWGLDTLWICYEVCIEREREGDGEIFIGRKREKRWENSEWQCLWKLIIEILRVKKFKDIFVIFDRKLKTIAWPIVRLDIVCKNFLYFFVRIIKSVCAFVRFQIKKERRIKWKSVLNKRGMAINKR